MYLLKRIVSFGSGGSNENSSTSDPSKSEPSKNENQDVNMQPTSKKSKKKRRKTKAPVEILSDVQKIETDDDDDEVEEKKHEIPDKFYDDLSETDVSKTGNSTAEDVSSDLSDNQPIQKSVDVDFWADNPQDDLESKKNTVENFDQKEDINFDDFWADFDKHDGQSKKKSLDENIDVSDESKVLDETDNIDSFWAEKENDLPPIAEINLLKRQSESLDKISIETENEIPGMHDDSVHVPTEKGKSKSKSKSKERSPSKIKKSKSSTPVSEGNLGDKDRAPNEDDNIDNELTKSEPAINKIETDRSLSFESPDRSLEERSQSKIKSSKSSTPNEGDNIDKELTKSEPAKIERDRSLSIESPDRLSAERSQSKIKNSKSSTPVSEGSLEDKDRTPSEGGNIDYKLTKSEPAISKIERDRSLSIESSERSLENQNKERRISKSKSKEKSPTKLRKLKRQKKEDTPDSELSSFDKQSTPDKSENFSEEVEKSENQSENLLSNNQNQEMSLEKEELTSEKCEVSSSIMSRENSVDKDSTSDQNENTEAEKINSQSTESESKDETLEQIDEKNETSEYSETNKITENDSFWNDTEDMPPVFTIKALNKENSEETSFIEKSQSPESSTDESSVTNVSDERNSEDKETTNEEKEDERKEFEKIRDEKESHRRSFAKALQDIEAPVRRRSVLLPDSRERVSIDESAPSLSSRSQHYSESSTDGEASHDDGIMDFLGKENDRAEARLAARRQARVEAREIRMRELERVQKEQEETSDKVFDLHSTPAHLTTPPHLTGSRQPAMSPRERPTSNNSYHSSRRSSEDSMEDGLSLRDIRHELKEVEEKFRKAMIANAQLDNEKAALAYQVELLKDKLEDLEETHSQLGKEHRERCREHEALKRAAIKLKEELSGCKMYLEERDRLIADYGLIIVGGEIDEKGEVTPRALVSSQSAQVLESAGEGSLDVRLKTLFTDKNDLVDEVRHLKLELEEERNGRRNEQSISNGPIGDEIQQTLNDYRFRLQKAEQDTSTLQATVARLESQVIRYKSAAEESEKAEDELKQEKRKLLREHRESIARIEELETSNSHLQRRMDKLKNAKSNLLKEL